MSVCVRVNWSCKRVGLCVRATLNSRTKEINRIEEKNGCIICACWCNGEYHLYTEKHSTSATFFNLKAENLFRYANGIVHFSSYGWQSLLLKIFRCPCTNDWVVHIRGVGLLNLQLQFAYFVQRSVPIFCILMTRAIISMSASRIFFVIQLLDCIIDSTRQKILHNKRRTRINRYSNLSVQNPWE